MTVASQNSGGDASGGSGGSGGSISSGGGGGATVPGQTVGGSSGGLQFGPAGLSPSATARAPLSVNSPATFMSSGSGGSSTWTAAGDTPAGMPQPAPSPEADGPGGTGTGTGRDGGPADAPSSPGTTPATRPGAAEPPQRGRLGEFAQNPGPVPGRAASSGASWARSPAPCRSPACWSRCWR